MACYTFWHKLHVSNKIVYKATQAKCAISACCGIIAHLFEKQSKENPRTLLNIQIC